MCNIKQCSDALTTSLIDSDLSGIPADLLETSIDQYLDEGVLQDIPIVKTFMGLIKTGRNIKDKLFLKKIITFLQNLQDVDVKKRQEMIEEIDGSSQYQLKVGEKLLYILDHCEDYEKASYIAKLFKCFINEQIDYFHFNILVDLINNMPTVILRHFLAVDIDRPQEINREIAQLYIRYGLMHTAMHIIDLGGSEVNEEDNEAEYTDIAKAIYVLLK